MQAAKTRANAMMARAIVKSRRAARGRRSVIHKKHIDVSPFLEHPADGAKLMRQNRQPSHRAKQAGFEQVKAGATIHLALHQLQFCVLPLGLAIRPWFSESRRYRGLILNDA